MWKLESITIHGMASSVDADDTDWMIDENFAISRSGSQKASRYPIQKLKFNMATKELDWAESFLGRYEACGDRLTICRPKI